MSGKTETTEPNPTTKRKGRIVQRDAAKQEYAENKGVPLTSAEAWDLRGLLEQAGALRAQAQQIDAHAQRVAAAACERAGVKYDPAMALHVDDGVVVLRKPDAPKKGEEA